MAPARAPIILANFGQERKQ